MALFFASLLLGIGLRFVWVGDIEYKGDERLMFELSRAVGESVPWPALGMPSGNGIRNPGMSIWIFVALGRLTRATSPEALAMDVMALNSLALLMFAALALRRVRSAEREAWLWALAIASVNPVAVQLQRKIWAQSTLPFFGALFLGAWFGRRSRAGAAAWGLLGACLGQIHMSGFFFAAALALGTAIFDRSSARWRWWGTGTALGLIPLLPWLAYLFANTSDLYPPLPWAEVLSFPFAWLWLAEPLGHGIDYSLGAEAFADYLAGPRWFGSETHLLSMAHAASITVGILFIGWSLLCAAPRALLAYREQGHAANDETGIAQNSALWIFGPLLTLTRATVYRHYLLVAYPLQYVFLAREGLRFPRLARLGLSVIWTANLILSLGFLDYIHEHGGAPKGDYGVALSAQEGRGSP